MNTFMNAPEKNYTDFVWKFAAFPYGLNQKFQIKPV